MSKLGAIHPVFWIAIAVFSASAQAKCKLELLDPQASTVKIDAVVVDLGEPDDPLRPTAWQGPLVAGQCKFEIGIVERPLALTLGRLLYVPVYSGSMRQLVLIDFNSCTSKWTSPAFSGELIFGERELKLGGQKIALDANCIPIAKK